MRCKEFNRLLNEIYSREPTRAEQHDMEAHRASCCRCAGVWQAERMLRAMIVPPTPPTLLERIVAFIDEIAAGTVVPFPARRTIVIASLILAGAAAAATSTLVILERMDESGDTVSAAVLPVEVLKAEDTGVTPAPAPAPAPAFAFAVDPVAIELAAADEPAPIGASETGAADEDDANDRRLPDAADSEAAQDEGPEYLANEVARSDVDAPIVEAPEDDVPEEVVPNSPEPELRVVVALPIAEPLEVEVASEAPSPGRNWLETKAEIEELIAAADFQAAADLGETLVEQVRAEFGDPSTALADAYLLIARALREQGDLVAATLQILKAVDTLETIELAARNRRSDPTQLIDALLLLGDTSDLMGDHEFALESYSQARDIARRTWGFLSLDEINIIERMTNSYVAAGGIGAARELQRELKRMALLEYGEASVEAIQAHYRYARWLRNHADMGERWVREVSLAYEDARGIIGRHFLDGDPELAIFLLLDHAREMLSGGLDWGQESVGLALRSLTRARQKYTNSKLDNPLLLANIARDLGDWYVLAHAYYSEDAFRLISRADRGALSGASSRLTLSDSRGDFAARNFRDALRAAGLRGEGNVAPGEMAARNYHEAWLALGSLPNGEALREAWFGELSMINESFINSVALISDLQAPTGFVEVEFTLNVFGRANEVHVTDSSPAGLMDNTVVRWVRASQFRPLVVDGRTVVAYGRLRYPFRYDPAQVPSASESESESEEYTLRDSISSSPQEREDEANGDAYVDARRGAAGEDDSGVPDGDFLTEAWETSLALYP